MGTNTTAEVVVVAIVVVALQVVKVVVVGILYSKSWNVQFKKLNKKVGMI